MADKQERYLSLITTLGPEALTPRAFSGEEGISELFRFVVEAVSSQSDLDFDQLVGHAATLTIELGGGRRRHLSGVVGRFAQAGRTARGRAIYRLELRPDLWLLTMSSDCRIFRQASTPEIVAEVLADHGLEADASRLAGGYRQHEFRVQYNESDFDFISRLLEEEGIFYFFEHAEDAHTLVLADDSAALEPCPGGEVAYGAAAEGPPESAVLDCTLEQTVIPGKSAVDDYNFETPSTDLMASVDSVAARDGARRRLYEYPGGFGTRQEGESLAAVRVEEQDRRQWRLAGDSRAAGLASGHRFTLAGHYREDANGDYVVTRVSHRADRRSYANSFEALPRAVSYRPPRVTPRPRIAGSQTAIVVGPSGEEVWTDRHGRVKVQFHWDQQGKRDENSSCWVRVSHAWAGKRWGQLFLPRIGQEVVVNFEEGDPRRPVIVGRLYNAEQTPPAALPEEGTRSVVRSQSSPGGGGANELRFEDAKGSEEVYLGAERNLEIAVGNDGRLQVGGSLAVAVREGRLETGERLEIRGASLVIGAESGLTIEVGEARLEMAPDSIKLSAPTIELAAGAGLEVQAGGGVEVQAGGKIKLRAAGAVDLEAAATMTITGALVKIN